MFKSNRMLALDIGASKLVIAEFMVGKDGVPELVNYGIGKLGLDASAETDSSAYIVSTVREIIRENGLRPAPLLMTVSGQTVFPRYVKLPPVARDKIMQIIRYEAEQNVPFPIEDVVWDYQLLGDETQDEVNVMLVAVKTDNVSMLTDCVVAAGLEPQVVDVAPMALYNLVRYNYPDLQGCTMVLDIGARSSNLIFLEEERVFSRSIPVAGNAITHELMKEFDESFEEAEKLKTEHAFVAFGGVYAGPDNEVADRVSKIVRNVITRLHAEVNRSINFYRSQQGGSPPSLVLLTGGSSMIPHTDTFFREKLKVEVDYLNPFVSIPVSNEIDTDRIENDLQMLGEVTGLAIRRSLACPVEINLMPPDLVAKKVFRKRQPYFALASVGLVLVMLSWWVYFRKMSTVWDARVQKLEIRRDVLKETDADLKKAIVREKETAEKLGEIVKVASKKSHWLEWIEGIHGCLLEGMWLRSLKPVEEDGVFFIEITGRGFEDNLEKFDTDNATAIEVFQNRLRSCSHFSADTRIKSERDAGRKAFLRNFTILVAIEGQSTTPATPEAEEDKE
ncbi:MAG: type IV pilus assembly protein PilM [Kiritimatiellia bacterium]|nr:type IV pilus assembly protein PilM [Kiritimatiellia bacterium]